MSTKKITLRQVKPPPKTATLRRSSNKSSKQKPLVTRQHRPSTPMGKLDFYKIFWIFVLGGLIGYLWEGFYFSLKLGYWGGNNGVLYGPFNQIYGFGAALMILLIYPFKKKPWWHIFLLGSVIGGLFEFMASLIQEQLLGYVSWNYHGYFLNLGGRTTIPYMLFWGLAALLLFKFIYPAFQKVYHRIPADVLRFATAGAIFFLILNFAISALAIHRMAEREKNRPATTILQVFLDRYYPDSRLEKVYPHLQQNQAN